jgi:hypothetical protein
MGEDMRRNLLCGRRDSAIKLKVVDGKPDRKR